MKQSEKRSVQYVANCGSCGRSLGKHAHDEGQRPKVHYCHHCSVARAKAGKHDPAGAVITFELLCGKGCGKVLAYNSFPEGWVSGKPEFFDKEFECPGNCKPEKK